MEFFPNKANLNSLKAKYYKVINVRRHSIALLALLSIVVVLSGCTVGGEAGYGTASGVIIKSFGPDISEVFSGDAVTFSLSVENVGGEDANEVSARIFGLGTQWTFTSARTQDIGFLERNVPEYGQGGWGDALWDLVAPGALRVDNEYTAGVRLSYLYGTSAMGDIRLYDNAYLRSNPEEAESIMRASGLESFSVTDAPLRISLAGVARPLVYREGSMNQASITFLVENSGQGKPYWTDETDMTFYVDSVTVNGVDCDLGLTSNEVRLPRTGKKSLSCRFTMPAPTTGWEAYTTIPVEMQISYRYFVDSSGSITVLKSLFTNGGPTTTSPTIPTP